MADKRVENLSEAHGERPAPQAELTLEISRMVSRVLAGEEIDTTATGDELALRFPGAGMTGTMIADAIDRAAGMVGMIREGGSSVEPPLTLAEDEMPLSMEEEIAAVVREQQSEDTAEEPEEEAQMPRGNGARPAEETVEAAANDAPVAPTPTPARPAEGRGKTGGAFAAIRRAFFRN